MDEELNYIDILNKEFPARDEQELIELFSAMLFAKEGPDGETWQRPKDFSLSAIGTKRLAEKGIIQRIFRRWYQTTWGSGSWSRHFSGETPRQELARKYPETARGQRFLTVRMSGNGKDPKPEPVVFPDDKSENLFIGNLSAHLAPRKTLTKPDLDPDFEQFFYWLLKMEKDHQLLKQQLPTGIREKYLRLFWEQTGSKLIFNIELELPKPEKLAISGIIQNQLTEFIIGHAANGRDDFLITDDLFRKLWPTLEKADPRLLPFEKLAEDEKFFNEQMDSKNPDPNFIYSQKLFYQLGVSFDRDILFPLDLYFGATEVVWQEQMNYIGCLGIAFSLLNGTLDPSQNPLPENDPMRDVEKYVLDITQLWFVPPSFFRLFPWARETLKEK